MEFTIQAPFRYTQTFIWNHIDLKSIAQLGSFHNIQHIIKLYQ